MTSYFLYAAAPILALLAIAFLIGRASWKRRGQEKEHLRDIARTFGFTYSEPETSSTFARVVGGWEIQGTYNGIPVRVYGKKVSGSGGSSSELTFIDAVADCRTKCELTITRKTRLGRLARALFGLQGFPTGNEELDRRLVVRGVPVHVVTKIVGDQKLQRELLRLFEHEGAMHVDLRGAHYRRSRLFTDAQTLRPLLDAMTRTASALQEATA